VAGKSSFSQAKGLHSVKANWEAIVELLAHPHPECSDCSPLFPFLLPA